MVMWIEPEAGSARRNSLLGQSEATKRAFWESFLVQYCERGVSVARQYYRARKRSDESPIEYLHRLNVADMRAKLPIKGGTPSTRCEHMEHFIETLDDHDLADQLVLLRLRGADELEVTLRLRQRSKSRQGRVAVGSNKFRKPVAPTTNSASAKLARVVHAIQTADGSSSSDSDDSGSDQDAGYHRIHVAAANDRDAQENQASNYREFPSQNQRPDRDRSPQVKQADGGMDRSPERSSWTERGVARNPLSDARGEAASLHAHDGMVGSEPRHHVCGPNDACGVAQNPLSARIPAPRDTTTSAAGND
ncbi:unnamed protein product [Phytophthora fragariaefolia]|uniref:Unnamed protein product n=1 Tax=Phytophthora fragariaefolia TaxID=1490495 RepID=A0A9W6XSG1_9STRA|nr:unnamed protein product [Phytophthora fragariaefolia]